MVCRPTVFPTKSRKFYQRLLDLSIWIHENSWEGNKNVSVLPNLTVINTIRTSHGNNEKRIVVLLCAGCNHGFIQSRPVRRNGSYRFSRQRRWWGECHQKSCFFPAGFTHELRMDWNSWRSSVPVIASWNSRHKHFSSWFCFCYQAVAYRGGGRFKPPLPPKIPKFCESRTGLQIERKMFIVPIPT